MLDVHPPEHAAHTWRDFFTHIATIVVGLLIAVALEQTVEYLHHRHQVHELRESLAEEREENRRILPVNEASFRLQMVELRNNLRVLFYLRDHPGSAEERLPGVLVWRTSRDAPAEATWKSAQQEQVLSLMPRDETQHYQIFYSLQDDTEQQVHTMFQSMERASSFQILDPNPSHLSPAQLAAVIDLTRDAMQATTTWGIYLLNLGRDEPEHASPLTGREITEALGELRSPEDQTKLSAAAAITDQTLAPWKVKYEAAEKAQSPDAK